MTPALLTACGAGFLLTLALTPVACRLARRTGLLDRPDGRRKIHPEPVPLAGGIAVFCAMFGAFVITALVSEKFASEVVAQSHAVLALALAATLIAIVGIIDDRFTLRGRYKLAGQLAAVAVMLASGDVIDSIDMFGWVIQLGYFAVPFTVLWLLGAINSLNLLDGMDGMLSSVGATIALTLAAMACWNGNCMTAVAALALAGALGGFLVFNLPPARVFLGDCGSMLIGLVLGVLALHSALKGPTTVMLTIPVVVLILPLLDTTAAITRRTLTGRSIYATDRGHLHHCLQRSGLSKRRILLLVVFLTLFAGLGALASLAFQRQALAIGSAVAIVGILTVTRLFGYAELLLAKERLASLVVRLRYGHQHHRTHELSVQLQGSADWADLWQTLIDTANQLSLLTLRLDVNIPVIQEGFHARWDRLYAPPENVPVWRAEIPLTLSDQTIGRIEITGLRSQDSVWEKISILSKIALDIEQSAAALTDSHRRTPIAAQGIIRPALALPAETLSGVGS